jgi:hypothetical protein
MIAAPGSVIFPTPLASVRSSRLPPWRRQESSSASIAAARAFGALPPWSSLASTGSTFISRTSWVAAAFIAETIWAGVTLRLCPRLRSKSWTRWALPNAQLSSGASYPASGRLFQLTISPLGGLMPWG